MFFFEKISCMHACIMKRLHGISTLDPHFFHYNYILLKIVTFVDPNRKFDFLTLWNDKSQVLFSRKLGDNFLNFFAAWRKFIELWTYFQGNPWKGHSFHSLLPSSGVLPVHKIPLDWGTCSRARSQQQNFVFPDSPWKGHSCHSQWPAW